MRASYGARMLECMQELGVNAGQLKDVVDMGCATGGVMDLEMKYKCEYMGIHVQKYPCHCFSDRHES